MAKYVERVVAVDLSPNTIEVARERAKNQTNIDFFVANILQWNFPTEEFDAIVTSIIPDPSEKFRQSQAESKLLF